MAKNLSIVANGISGDEGHLLGYNVSDNGIYTPAIGDVVRGTTATYVAQDGTIKTAPPNVARVDYTNGVAELLLEPSSTNLITYSEDFSQWNKLNSTAQLTSSSISSFGNYTKFETAVLGGRLANIPPTSHSGIVTFSIYAKKGTAKGIRIRFDASIDANCWVNLENGTEISPNTGQSIKIIPFNDFYRIEFTANIVSLGQIRLYTIGENSTQDVIGNIYIYGGQLEQKSYATSYILTNGGTASRSADILTRFGISQIIDSQSGMLFFEGSGLSDSGTSRRISLSDASTTNNRVVLEFDENTNIIKAFLSGNSTTISLTTSVNKTENVKYALRYGNSTFSLFVNGVLKDSTSYTNSPTSMNELLFCQQGNTSPFYGRVRQVKHLPYSTNISKL